MQLHREDRSSMIKLDQTVVERREQWPSSTGEGGAVRVSLIDVGKGDCILLQSGQ